MIIGFLSRWAEDKRYYPAVFDRAIQFLLHGGPLAPGKYSIDGDAVFASVQKITTRASDERLFEIHQRYIDIQVPLSGPERYGVLALPPSVPSLRDTLAENDAAMYPHPGEATFMVLQPRQYAVFFPGEQHCPGCTVDAPEEVLKCVLKIRVDCIGGEIPPKNPA